ncbi:HIT family protein [Paenibacillus abyssi]|uniref:HIT family protein n=1 Tax=Paenibacillus abyssi TaxID=1340531 RepID=A0A917D2C5_9BACL|nr:HIT domain-containing protein [Paenibacillus abyssi]GGG07596.1 HIT family protein [Paenibacillus abyssi]
MKRDCIFCNIELEPKQKIILKNEHCLFLQLEEAQVKGANLEGAGLIVPIQHRETAFDLTSEEWESTYSLLQDVKKYLDTVYKPQGYNLGWNCGEVGGQHIFHSHFHVIPRYQDEPLAGKGIRYMLKSSVNERKSN